MKRLITNLSRLLAVVGLLTITLLPAATAVAADPAATSSTDAAKSQICTGVGLTTDNGDCSDTGTTVGDIIRLVISILSFIVGVAAVIMVIVGGFRYVTSAGEGTKTAQAKDTIIYAIVGLIVALLAQVLVRFVLSKADVALPNCPPGQTQMSDGSACN